MFESFQEFYQIDWRIFMAGVEAWLDGRSPYGYLGSDMVAGTFAYPPTALTWLVLLRPLGPLGFYVWTAMQLYLWWRLARDEQPNYLLLVFWAPMASHLVLGQATLPVVLVLWAATRAERRGWLWGLALAWAMTKPQVALLPLLWLLWLDRASPLRWQLWGGIAVGTLLLALPATLINPTIWLDWVASLSTYRGRVLQMTAWQGPSVLLLGLAAYVWWRNVGGGWQWWLSAALFPHVSYYSIVPLLPALRPRQNYWTLAALGLAGVLQLAPTELVLPWMLAGHIFAASLMAGRGGVGVARREAVSEGR